MSSSPPTPHPTSLEYRTPDKARRRPVVDVPLLITCLYSVAVLSAMVLFAVPYVWSMEAPTLKEYAVRLPGATTSLLAFSNICRSGGVVLLWVIFLIPPFVSARMMPWPPVETRRRYFRWSRLIVTMVLTIFCVWIVVGLVLPHALLLDALSSGPKKAGG
jgi:hypothetical protein